MHKSLQFDRLNPLLLSILPHGVTDSAYLAEPQFAGEYHAPEAHALEPDSLFGCAVVALGGGMQANRWHIAVQQGEVLNNQRRDTCLV